MPESRSTTGAVDDALMAENLDLAQSLTNASAMRSRKRGTRNITPSVLMQPSIWSRVAWRRKCRPDQSAHSKPVSKVVTVSSNGDIEAKHRAVDKGVFGVGAILTEPHRLDEARAVSSVDECGERVEVSATLDARTREVEGRTGTRL